jgi:hypothetical protein
MILYKVMIQKRKFSTMTSGILRGAIVESRVLLLYVNARGGFAYCATQILGDPMGYSRFGPRSLI